MASPRMRCRQEDDASEPLPLPPGPVSNGEFIPASATRHDHDVAQVALQLAEDARRAAGIDRRQFLQTAGGVAASLAAFNLAACSPRSRAVQRHFAPGTTGGLPGGTFHVPSTRDIAACEAQLGARDEFIFDVHTHHVMPDRPWRHNAPESVGLVLGMVPPDCRAANRLECVNRSAYLHDLFLASDTTVALLSDVPNSGPDDAAVPFVDALGTQQLAAQLAHGGAARVLLHRVIAPNVGDLGARLDDMSAAASSGHVAAFKVYTAWSPSGQGYSLEDPRIGLPVVQRAHDLGVNVFVAHKGLPLVHFDASHNRPDDIVAVSRQFPDMNFVVFHGAWDPHRREGPFQPGAAVGIDSFLDALDRHSVPLNDNVWVDLGTVWRQLLTDPDQAAHAVGKLLKRVGEDRVLWGTDAIWYGSPQAQIMALRAFHIGTTYQERFGYPELTDQRKRKILGLNAARLFAIDPTATRCALASDPLASAQPEAAALRAEAALPSPWHPHGPTSRRDVLRWLASHATQWQPA